MALRVGIKILAALFCFRSSGTPLRLLTDVCHRKVSLMFLLEKWGIVISLTNSSGVTCSTTPSLRVFCKDTSLSDVDDSLKTTGLHTCSEHIDRPAEERRIAAIFIC